MTGAGEVGADVDVDDVKALRQDGAKKLLELLRTHCRRLGQGAVPMEVGVEILGGIVAIIGENTLSGLDGQGYSADLKAFQQCRGQVAGAVIGDANRSGHEAIPPIFFFSILVYPANLNTGSKKLDFSGGM